MCFILQLETEGLESSVSEVAQHIVCVPRVETTIITVRQQDTVITVYTQPGHKLIIHTVPKPTQMCTRERERKQSHVLWIKMLLCVLGLQ